MPLWEVLLLKPLIGLFVIVCLAALFWFAEAIASLIYRFLPDGRLKRLLLFDGTHGRLAADPASRRESIAQRLAFLSREPGE